MFISSSGCIHSDFGDMRYKVYIWGFSYLNYPLNVLISWIQQLSLYNWVCPHLYIIHYLMLHYMLVNVCSKHDFLYITCLLSILVLNLFIFTVRCMPTWLEYTARYFCTCVFTCICHLAFILHTRWVAFLIISGPVCPNLETWTVMDPFLEIRVVQRSMVDQLSHPQLVSFWPTLEILLLQFVSFHYFCTL